MCVCGCNCCKTFISAWPKLARDLFPCHCSPLSLFLPSFPSLFIPLLWPFPLCQPPVVVLPVEAILCHYFLWFCIFHLASSFAFCSHTHTHISARTHTRTQGQKLLLMTLTGWAGTPPFGRSVRARALQLSFMQSQPHTQSHTVKHTHPHIHTLTHKWAATMAEHLLPLTSPHPSLPGPVPACCCPRTWLAIRPQIASWACHLVAPPPPHTHYSPLPTG